MFAAVRHPDLPTLGIIPQGALEQQRVLGWYRVSEWRPQPSDIHLPAYAESYVDLDAPEPQPIEEPAEEPAQTTKESKS